ncbi:type IV secretory system conjugative DNA transfer family protein [Rhizobium sp. C4]|uniref:type IV secretory system conjugative DNA transfer family protein n=1 Tax=Rhizobium sp. C4 TaxID=1349800 RepID=UPI001E4CD804|nr:type IV secretory system conjugative DNA transfer family protein [Rhizobium sp. C4]MCD2174938.1 type IV secretory system conjugative DNA transfer family protein [Rhizobium sp. C4]
MKRFEKIALSTVGPIAAVGATIYAWSLNYSVASFVILKSSTMWKGFSGGEIFMPIRQASTYIDNPSVMRLVKAATTATFAEAAVVAGAVALAIIRPWEVRPPSDGSRFATLEDLKKAGLIDGHPGKSVLLGTFGKGRQTVDVRYSGDSHFFVNGPSRAGKGRGFVMTNLLEYEGSVVVLDVKLENYLNTGAARLAMGQTCFVFAPGSVKTHRWNPLDFVRGWPERSTDLINLSASLLPIGEREDGYWKQTARGLLAGVLGYVMEAKSMEGRRNFRSVLRMFSTGRSFSDVLTEIIDTEPELNDFILGSFRQHLGRDEEQRPSFEGHIVTALAPFNNLLIAEACAQSDFDIRDLRRAPFSLFIAAPVSDFGTVEPIIRLLIQQIHDVMLRSLPGKDEPHKILMMLDEFYQFERLPEIIKRAPLVAGYGLTIALVAQNIPQIDERYGQKTRDALLGNMDIKLCIAVGDDATARIVSDNLGRKYEEREGWGKQTSLLAGKRASTGRFELVPLMDPGAIQRLDDTKTILQVRSGYGAILNKLNFYTDSRFLQRRREVESFTRHLAIPDLAIQPEWPLFEAPAASLNSYKAGSDAQRQFDNDANITGTSNSSTDHDFEILAAAMEVFADTTRFIHQFRNAMNAIDDQAIADLLFRLRTAPETLGGLRGTSVRFDRKGRRERKAAMEAVWRLREVVTAARWARIADAMNAHVAAFTWSFVQGFVQSEGNGTFASDPVDVLPAHSDVAAESNQLEIGHAQLSGVIDEITEMVTKETQASPNAEPINDRSRAIDAAVARLKLSTAAAILDDDQLPDAIQADNEDVGPPTLDATNQQPDITE